MAATQMYNVPVILPDLRREESYRQIVDALEYLDAVATDIFNRISCRVADNRDQLTTINNRINVAQAKIDKLRSSSSKATTVFSSPKYPAPDAIQEYHTIYHQVSPALQKVRKTKANIESRLAEVTSETLQSKSRPFLFSLRVKRQARDAAILDDPEMGEGLGSLPRHLTSVSSLLLFNTSENPYKKYVLLDPLEGAMTKTRDKLIEEESELSEAPVTITLGEDLLRGPQDSILYVPLMPELPELDVPDMLPQLQYVAVDTFYQGDSGASIAPSLAHTQVPDLPNLADPNAPAATAPSGSAAPPTQVPPAKEPPPPPPPPMNEVPELPDVLDSDEDDDDASSPLAGVPAEAGGDGRANLMDAIRKAGGASKAGLKNAKHKKHARKAKKEVDTGGDLLGDLSAALSRRRKAMSGKEKERNEERERREEKKAEDHSLGGGSMMDNISRMIPAPPKAPKPMRKKVEKVKIESDSGGDSGDGGGGW